MGTMPKKPTPTPEEPRGREVTAHFTQRAMEAHLSPSDKKVYTRVRKAPVRSEDETLLTINLPKELKALLKERSEKTDRPVAKLVRWALEFQEKNGWKYVAEALTPQEMMELVKSGWKFNT